MNGPRNTALAALDSVERVPYRAALVALLALVAITLLFADLNLRASALFFSHIVNTTFIGLGVAVLAITCIMRRDWRGAVLPVLTVLGITMVVHVTKFLFGCWTPRPSGSGGGFPSGHAATAFVLAFLLSSRYPRLAGIWYGIAVAIGWSRIEMRSHYLYQVVGGAILGLAFCAVMRLEERVSQSAPKPDANAV
jgi:membrane-associated phospholipid phosphatase